MRHNSRRQGAARGIARNAQPRRIDAELLGLRGDMISAPQSHPPGRTGKGCSGASR